MISNAPTSRLRDAVWLMDVGHLHLEGVPIRMAPTGARARHVMAEVASKYARGREQR
jgi:hypothetical protein